MNYKIMNKRAFQHLELMAAMMAQVDENIYSRDKRNSLKPEYINTNPIQPLPPKGCKEYWFNQYGTLSIYGMRKDEVDFYCMAMNEKSARRKFNNWKIKNKS